MNQKYGLSNKMSKNSGSFTYTLRIYLCPHYPLPLLSLLCLARKQIRALIGIVLRGNVLLHGGRELSGRGGEGISMKDLVLQQLISPLILLIIIII